MYTLVLRHKITRAKLIVSALTLTDVKRVYRDLEDEYRFDRLEYYNPEVFDSDLNRKIINDAKEFLL